MCIKNFLRESETKIIGYVPENMKALLLDVKRKVGHKEIRNKKEDE